MAEEKEAEAQGEKASTAEGGAYEILKVRWATFKLRWCVAVHTVTDRPRFAQFSQAVSFPWYVSTLPFLLAEVHGVLLT